MRSTRQLRGQALVLGLAATLCGAVLATPAGAATFTVTSSADADAGSLRQAILDANADSTADVIEFNLAGATITPATALPTVTQPVTIDGTTDGVVYIDGTSAGSLANGLVLQAAGSTVKGLSIGNFALFGIAVTGNGNIVSQNDIGGDLGPNGDGGISISSNDNILVGNSIGRFGSGNGGHGIAITGSATGNRVGGIGAGDANSIVENGGAGVAVTGTGTGNAIIGNSFDSNAGLGIDLGTVGVTANDADDPDTGPNNLQNFPVITTFTTSAGTSTIAGTLNSTPSTTFRIDLYSGSQCDPSGNGEGPQYLGSANLSTDSGGDASFSADLPEVSDRFVMATTTGPGGGGTGSTSEFSACAAGPPTGGVITNGTVQLGVNNTGDLNYSCTAGEAGCPGESAGGTAAVGLRYVPLNLDSTAPGCACEGWGMADAGSGLSGFANQSSGTANLTINSFTLSVDGTTAISDVTITDPSVPDASMNVVQNYHPSATSPNLYENTVTVTNTGTAALSDLRYRRVMDWDVEPTAFAEWSTIQGTSPQLLFDSDDGFASSDPLAGPSYIGSEAVCGPGYTGACAFTDLGSGGTYPTVTTPDDHGALFDFGFGALAQNASKTFKVYYGAAPTETAALNALAAGGAQVYSLGQSDCPNGGTTAGCDSLATGAGPLEGKPATFMFGFVTTTGDLSITKTDSADPVSVNDNLTYTLTIHNNGPEAAAGVTVQDVLPAGVTFQSATPSAGGNCSGTSTVTCTFPSIANDSSVTVTIVVTPNQAGQLSNTATVTAASADAVPGNNSSTQATTVNPDLPQASIGNATLTEGHSGTTNMTFTVTLDRDPLGTVSVAYATANASASQPADYTSASGTVNFDSGQTSKTIDVPIVGDLLDEIDETFLVNLTNPTGIVIADGQGQGTIIDDDEPPTVSIADAQLDPEGNTGTSSLILPVTLSQASGKTITVAYSLGAGGDTAGGGADYVATGGTVTFVPGETTKDVVVPVAGDTLDELDETLTVTLSSPTNVTLADATGLGTIIDDDAPPTVSAGDGSVAEGNSGTTTLSLTVTLSQPSGRPITVQYGTGALADSATPGADYTSVSGTLTFAPGVTTQTIAVPVLGDTLDELDETLTVTLASPTNVTLADATGLGTIVDDDAPPPPTGPPPTGTPPAVSVADVTVNPEGDSGTRTAVFSVTLSGAATAPVSVSFATSDGTASAGVDYTAATGSVSFAVGETAKSVNVTVNGDTVPEPDETFRITLSGPVNATLADPTGIATIVDDDQIGTPGPVKPGDLFCGTQHRGKCKGIKIKDEFDRPGNASWTFGAYNPSPGNSSRARASAKKPIRLGRVTRKVKAGKVSFTFKLKAGSKTRRLYRKVVKAKLRHLLITRTFTPPGGAAQTVTATVRLRR